jgi:beta-glucosidase
MKAHPGNLDAIKAAEKIGKPIVTLIVAGRNVLIGEYMDDWDGIVMCYLPGSEGDGVAAVLSGEADFTGRLPMPYFRSVEDIEKADAKLLYEAGYGLSYE